MSVLEPNSVKFRLSQSVDRNDKNVSNFYIVILKCYQTAIQYMSNVTLSLVVTPRHDITETSPYKSDPRFPPNIL